MVLQTEAIIKCKTDMLITESFCVAFIDNQLHKNNYKVLYKVGNLLTKTWILEHIFNDYWENKLGRYVIHVLLNINFSIKLSATFSFTHTFRDAYDKCN